MAQGDAQTDFITVSAGSATTVQPASGEHWKIIAAGYRDSGGWFISTLTNADLVPQYYDGTTPRGMGTRTSNNESGGIQSHFTGHNNYSVNHSPRINNTWYLRFDNRNSCNSSSGGYNAIQLK